MLNFVTSYPRTCTVPVWELRPNENVTILRRGGFREKNLFLISFEKLCYARLDLRFFTIDIKILQNQNFDVQPQFRFFDF